MQLFGQVGAPSQSLGVGSANVPFRQGQLGEMVVSELNGRFYEQAYRGNLYSAGTLAVNALSANTITLTNSTTPILGVYNPTTSTANLVILQASLQCFINSLTSGAGPGAFVWAWSVGNTAVSTGTAPLNRKTMVAAGSQAQGMVNTALTGLTNNLVIYEGADFQAPAGVTYTTIGSTSVSVPIGGVQNFDGSLIVPPGGVLALLNTTSCTTFSVVGRLLWEEVPL